MTTSPTSTPALAEVFDALRGAARTATAKGGVLYGAQAKTQLMRLFPDFDEQVLGFRKFIELLRAGSELGHFCLEIVDGHPRITADGPAVANHVVEQGRLKPDLWSALITWETGKRYWDRKHRRAIFLPTDEDGKPLWESSPDDFIEIDPVSMKEQLQWMRDFGIGHSELVRDKLFAALEESKSGAFKQTITDLGLSGAWKSYLQQRMLGYAAAWAARNGLPSTFIVEHRDRARTQPRPSSKPNESTQSDSETEQLRTRLHQIINDMSLVELSALPIPAVYLLNR